MCYKNSKEYVAAESMHSLIQTSDIELENLELEKKLSIAQLASSLVYQKNV